MDFSLKINVAIQYESHVSENSRKLIFGKSWQMLDLLT